MRQRSNVDRTRICPSYSSMIVASTAGKSTTATTVRIGPVDRARIHHERLAVPIDRGDVRVAVADEPVVAAVDRLAKPAAIVAVQQGDPHAVERPDRRTGRGTFGPLASIAAANASRSVVAIAEDEMRRPGGEQLDDRHRADVAAMQHGVDVEAFEHPHRRPRELHVAVRIADDAESHDRCTSLT